MADGLCFTGKVAETMGTGSSCKEAGTPPRLLLREGDRSQSLLLSIPRPSHPLGPESGSCSEMT